MKLFERRTPTREELIAAGDPPEVADWKLSGPSAGEVYVYTGEPSAADSRKLHMDLSCPETRERLRRVGEITHAAVLADATWAEQNPEAAAARDAALQAGVDELMLSIGVDPRTLRPLA